MFQVQLFSFACNPSLLLGQNTPPSVARLCAGLMTCANMLSETAITRKSGCFASRRMAKETHTVSVPDGAVGTTNEAAVTLQTEARSLSQNLTLFPHDEVQCASNARCLSRSVCGGQDEAVGSFWCGFTLEMRAQERQY